MADFAPFTGFEGIPSLLYLQPGLFVRIVELKSGVPPFPLRSGFTPDRAYRVMGGFNASESSEAYLILVNDRSELWFISNRHVRFAFLDDACMGPYAALCTSEEGFAPTAHRTAATAGTGGIVHMASTDGTRGAVANGVRGEGGDAQDGACLPQRSSDGVRASVAPSITGTAGLPPLP